MTDVEAADRELMSRLAEAGINPAGPGGLTFRLLCADGLTPAQVAATLGVAEGTVASRVSRIRAKLLAAQDQHARTQAPEPDPDDEEPDELTAAARLLLELVRNRAGEAGVETALPGAIMVTLGDAKGVIREAAARRLM